MPINLKTRPALITRRGGNERPADQLRMTVVFHPDTKRIGAKVDLAAWPAEGVGRLARPLTVGRHQPILTDGAPLNEPHVSRAAFEVVRTTGGGNPVNALRISACDDSHCAIGQQEQAAVVVDESVLRRGIPVRLGHGVVLLLRLVSPSTAPEPNLPGLSGVLGASVEMERLRQQLAAVAATELPVLILGEAGVGKEVVATAVHAVSPRASKPLISVNMSAIPEGLAGAELFGNVRGAFTGAQSREGFFQRADGSTLFLDEIGDTPESVQAYLLRALEQGEIQVVGGATRKVDVRVVAATDADVSRDSGFRHALHTRLAGYTLAIPPLRQRLEDIGSQGLAFARTPEALNAPFPITASEDDANVAAHWARFFFNGLSHSWPGNSRTLKQAVERAAHADPDIAPWRERTSDPVDAGSIALSDDAIYAAHHEYEFEVAASARSLGLSRQAMYRRIDAHPDCVLIKDYADQQIREAIETGGSTREVALRLQVSERALLQRLRNLRIE